VIRVRDDGVGIPAGKLAHIFDLFAQLDLGPDRPDSGLGIGLALVRRLVELQGGTITASSAGADQGSEFLVRLPVAADPPGQSEEAAPRAGSAPRRHFLIVEDNADNRDSLALLLGLFGHQVDVAEDGPKGLERALAV